MSTWIIMQRIAPMGHSHHGEGLAQLDNIQLLGGPHQQVVEEQALVSLGQQEQVAYSFKVAALQAAVPSTASTRALATLMGPASRN